MIIKCQNTSLFQINLHNKSIKNQYQLRFNYFACFQMLIKFLILQLFIFINMKRSKLKFVIFVLVLLSLSTTVICIQSKEDALQSTKTVNKTEVGSTTKPQVIQQNKTANDTSTENQTLSMQFLLEDKFIDAFTDQLKQWVGYRDAQHQKQIFQQCEFEKHRETCKKMYISLKETGNNFTLKHIDVIRQYLKEQPEVKQMFKCLIDNRITQNGYFNEKKRYKYFARFTKENQGGYAKEVFPTIYGEKQKGRVLGHYFKAFFEYYYLHIENPSETICTQFIRALTVYSDIFNHLDISYCLSIQTIGEISNELEGLDINNIYVKIPKMWASFQHIKWKDRCKDEQHLQMSENLRKRIGDMNIYKLMYHDYEPYVQLAAEKFGTSQIRKFAKQVSKLIKQHEKYTQMSKKQF